MLDNEPLLSARSSLGEESVFRLADGWLVCNESRGNDQDVREIIGHFDWTAKLVNDQVRRKSDVTRFN